MKHIYGRLYKHPCPGCNGYTEWKDDGNITLKIHCTEERGIRNFLQLWKGCTNADCEWSKILGASQNEWTNK